MRTRPAGAGRSAYRWVAARRSAAFDVMVAVVATIVELGLLFNDSTPVRPLPVALTVLTGGALLARRRAPLAVLAATCGAVEVLVLAGYSPGGAPTLVALYTVAELRDRRVSLATLVPVALFLMLASVASIPISIGAWALGSYFQARRRYILGLEERAAHLEREREQLTQIAAQQERASIARELHDIVAHSVAVTLVGVRGARDVLHTSPDVAAETLGRVETSAEQSLTELRQMLAVLRAPGQDVRMRPQPTLAQLPDLVGEYGAAGLPVHLELTGEPRTLPSGVELSAYRIVEEALTNALKHSDPTRVTVMLGFSRTDLDITVEDDGAERQRPTGSAVSTGHGIIGMRERVAVFGGELDTRRIPGGGFRVAARLPVKDGT
jgi:signal transduction histidine kinase